MTIAAKVGISRAVLDVLVAEAFSQAPEAHCAVDVQLAELMVSVAGTPLRLMVYGCMHGWCQSVVTGQQVSQFPYNAVKEDHSTLGRHRVEIKDDGCLP